MSSEKPSNPLDALLPILPLRNMVVYPTPQTVVPISVGRPKSIRLLEDLLDSEERHIVLIAQKEDTKEDPEISDMYAVGTLATVLKSIASPTEATLNIIVQGVQRVRLVAANSAQGYYMGTFEALEDVRTHDETEKALVKTLKDTAAEVVGAVDAIPSETLQMIARMDDPAHLSYFVAHHALEDVSNKQAILEDVHVNTRLENCVKILTSYLKISEVSEKIKRRIQEDSERTQKEYYLRQQMKAIQEQLGSGEDEMDDLEARIEEAGMPEAAYIAAEKQYNRLQGMQPSSSEYSVTLNYIETLLDIPWALASEDQLDLDRAQGVLDEDHYGLDKVKDRIVEFLAVRALKSDMKGPILCLHGPPGVGKAQPVDEPVLTPRGWVPMGALRVGDAVVGADGQAHAVTGVFPQGRLPIYRVAFSDGSYTRACADHLWYTRTANDRHAGREGSVKPLSQIMQSLRHGKENRRNHEIPMVHPVAFAPQALPINPYVLGALMCDASLGEEQRALMLRHAGFAPAEDGAIPDVYLRASVAQRVELLRGLMDINGSTKDGQRTRFATRLRALCESARDLVLSLGGTAVDLDPAEPGVYGFTLNLPPDICPFGVAARAQAFRPHLKYVPTRYVESVTLEGEMEAQCISVDAPDYLYVTRDYVVTHNTSLGKSIARTLGRKFVRISLGGVHDESEIRGHRRTYVGAMPGRIVQAMIKAGTHNPIILLDEIDKVGRDFRGDPSAALLEVLDPEQNHAFSDHYLEVPLDLSKVLFIATANQLDTISAPLRDRMEVIDVPSYTLYEKRHIAEKYLFPKQVEAHGLKPVNVVCDTATVQTLIDKYTREAGVRNLERRVADLCRKAAVTVAKSPEEEREGVRVVMDDAYVEKALGPERYTSEVAQRTNMVGVSTGLAWTQSGGDILFIEAQTMRGKGELKLTGQLGDVMKESVHAALSYIRANMDRFGISEEFNKTLDLHLHVPAGAIPKDGPSAGITMFTAILSRLTGVKVRKDVAMTGEITLSGNVLPVGGIREKVIAAHRAGITQVVMPDLCKKDLVDVEESVKKDITFHFVKEVEELLPIVFETNPFANT